MGLVPIVNAGVCERPSARKTRPCTSFCPANQANAPPIGSPTTAMLGPKRRSSLATSMTSPAGSPAGSRKRAKSFRSERWTGPVRLPCGHEAVERPRAYGRITDELVVEPVTNVRSEDAGREVPADERAGKMGAVGKDLAPEEEYAAARVDHGIAADDRPWLIGFAEAARCDRKRRNEHHLRAASGW